MTKNLILLLFLFTTIIARGQQDLNFSRIDFFQDMDDLNVINNPQMINPTLLSDTNKFIGKLNLYARWLGIDGSPTKTTASVQTKFSAISLGLNLDIKKFGSNTYRSLTSNIKRNWRINQKSGIDIGANLGIIQYKYWASDLFFDGGEEKSFLTPSIDLGFKYKINGHSLGVCYNFISTDITSYQTGGLYSYSIQKAELITSYQKSFNLSDKLIITSGLWGFFQSDLRYGIVALDLDYFNRIKIGMMYNTREVLTFHLSTIIKKRFNIGYLVSYNVSNHAPYSSGTHNINLGFIL
jgi:type IX secretion system PorP/SprF family membrane protein